jgi:hypothetical protein
MTTAERVKAIVDYGFTERQARFLVLVLRHSGLCIKRQYGTFAGVARGGEKCNAFFDKLIRRGYAVAIDCVHNRARLYHVHHKPLYYSIGEPESRYRRAVPAGQAAERLLRLDAALITPDLEWLTRRSEKLAYLAARTAPETSERPEAALVQDRSNMFPGTFPIGIDATGRVVLVYVATKPWTNDFRNYLVGHLELLSVPPAWTLRVVFPPALHRVVPDYKRAVCDELENRLDEETAGLLSWYFFHCQRRTDWTLSPYNRPGPDSLRARFDRCSKAFVGPRFNRLYQRWLAGDRAALTPIPATVSEAFASGRAALDFHLLSHSYDHLHPLVSRRRSQLRQITAEDTEGDEAHHGLNPVLNPAP